MCAIGQMAVSEREVISKHKTLPESLEDTIAVQISQTPPDHRPIEYFLTPLRMGGYLLEEEKNQIDLARAQAIGQMEGDLNQPLEDGALSAAAIRVLNKIRREVDVA